MIVIMKTKKGYLVPHDYMADPSVHVFNGKLYIYPLTTGKAVLRKMTMVIISI